MITSAGPTAAEAPSPTYHPSVLRDIAQRVLWLSAAIVDAANAGVGGSIVGELFPTNHSAPLVTVLDGHPHTLAFLGGVRGDRIRCLGVTEFGQSSGLDDAYRIHHIDTGSIVDAAMTMVGR